MQDSLKDCYICFLPSFFKKHLIYYIKAYNLLQFFPSYREKFLKPVNFITQSYLLPCKHTTCIPRWNDVETVVTRGVFVGLLLLNSFLFLSAFSAFLRSLNNYFFNGLLSSLFSVNKFYYVVSLSFYCMQLFPFFMVQVF